MPISASDDILRRNLEDLLSERIEDAMQRERNAFSPRAAPFQDRLVLFGAGGLGQRTLAGLREAGIEPLAFADNNQRLWGQSVKGVPVMPIEEAAARFGDNAAFVVTIWNGESTDRMAARIDQLRRCGCESVQPVGLLFWKYPDIFLPYYPLDLPHKLLGRADEVRRAFELWSDDASRREFVAQVGFRLHLDYDQLGSPGAEEHYFPPDLFCPSSNEVFVDCGAFDGDTIRSFVRRHASNFSQIFAYEPDPLNWPKLSATVSAYPESIRAKIRCFPEAVGARRDVVKFSATGTDLSRIGSGPTAVNCVMLDEALDPCAPTMIKFDIEGAELDALAGGCQVIRRHLPILAVSAYHQQSHLWEVPLAVAGISGDYALYLRPHGAEGWDLVCYAVPPRRRMLELP
jgi:FkbM family methyltransferase